MDNQNPIHNRKTSENVETPSPDVKKRVVVNCEEDESEEVTLLSAFDGIETSLLANHETSAVRIGRQHVAILALSLSVVTFLRITHMHQGTLSVSSLQSFPRDTDAGQVVTTYTCPASKAKAKNDVSDNFQFYFEDNEENTKHHNLSDYQELIFDGWGKTYSEVKSILKPWKLDVFAPNLKSGDIIYESACGGGFNLLLTAEILQEVGIHNITVFGNDYLETSIQIANEMWSLPSTSSVAHKGVFCPGDSSNLSFAPSSMFDLVYCGYVDPLPNPASLWDDNLTLNEMVDKSIELCTSVAPGDQELRDKGQRAQEDWYASWVSEMIRIAKPGKIIAVELESHSICHQEDWGGVEPEWWTDTSTIAEYGWDVDPTSIVTRVAGYQQDDWVSYRYHVMMRKRD